MLAQGEQANDANLAPFQVAASKRPEMARRFSIEAPEHASAARSLFVDLAGLFSLFWLMIGKLVFWAVLREVFLRETIQL
ncbi:hypothetical protein EBZ70_12035 [bacterium]|nr:hypothetical protein [bacterium]